MALIDSSGGGGYSDNGFRDSTSTRSTSTGSSSGGYSNNGFRDSTSTRSTSIGGSNGGSAAGTSDFRDPTRGSNYGSPFSGGSQAPTSDFRSPTQGSAYGGNISAASVSDFRSTSIGHALAAAAGYNGPTTSEQISHAITGPRGTMGTWGNTGQLNSAFATGNLPASMAHAPNSAVAGPAMSPISGATARQGLPTYSGPKGYRGASLYGNTIAYSKDPTATLDTLSHLETEQVRNAATISNYAHQYGLDLDKALAIGAIESQLGAVKDRTNTQYQGVMQIGNKEFAKYATPESLALGKTNPMANIQAGMAYAGALQNALVAKGIEPTVGNIYGAYNQGLGGFTGLLSNPSALAKEVVPYSHVFGNLPKSMKNRASTITAGEFAKIVSGYPEKSLASLTKTNGQTAVGGMYAAAAQNRSAPAYAANSTPSNVTTASAATPTSDTLAQQKAIDAIEANRRATAYQVGMANLAGAYNKGQVSIGDALNELNTVYGGRVAFANTTDAKAKAAAAAMYGSMPSVGNFNVSIGDLKAAVDAGQITDPQVVAEINKNYTAATTGFGGLFAGADTMANITGYFTGKPTATAASTPAISTAFNQPTPPHSMTPTRVASMGFSTPEFTHSMAPTQVASTGFSAPAFPHSVTPASAYQTAAAPIGIKTGTVAYNYPQRLSPPAAAALQTGVGTVASILGGPLLGVAASKATLAVANRALNAPAVAALNPSAPGFVDRLAGLLESGSASERQQAAAAVVALNDANALDNPSAVIGNALSSNNIDAAFASLAKGVDPFSGKAVA